MDGPGEPSIVNVTAAAPPASGHHAARGRLLVFGAAFLWGTSATLARSVFRDEHVPALLVVALRLSIAAALLAPWLALRAPHKLKIDRRDVGYLLILGLFGVAAVQGSYYYSISVLGVGLAILIQYLAPSLIVLLQLARGARVSAATLFAVAAALAGTALLVGNVDRTTLHATPLQWLISSLSAAIFAFYILYSKRGLARYAPETILFYTFAIAAIFWLIVTPPWVIAAQHYPLRLWFLFLLLGIFSTLAPFSLFYAGLRHLPATEAGIVATLEPVVAVISASVFLGEGLSGWQWMGAVMVLVASALASRAPAQAVAQHA